MLNANEVYKVPSSLKWYQLTYLVIIAIIISIPFGFGGKFFGALWLLGIFFVLPFWLFMLMADRAISYTYDDNRLTINSGILSKQSNNIPYPNVQNVKINTGLLMNLFGLAGISIWTASQGQIGSRRNSKPDGYLKLNKEDAQQLEEIILRRK